MISMSRVQRSRSLGRGALLSACLCAIATPAPAGAQAPAPDPYEPNDSQQTATAMEPETRYVAAIAGPSDSDWFAIAVGSPSWQTAFSGGTFDTLSISAEREMGCAELSLRITVAAPDGQYGKSAVVYPGLEAGYLSLPVDRGITRYDLKVDTQLDPACPQMRYAITAEPFRRPPLTGSTPGNGPDIRPSPAECSVLKKQKRGLNNRIRSKRTRSLSKPRRAKLLKKLNADVARINGAMKANHCL
ncbi:MAG: hypothetical protein QOJ35_1430 [Solirubrobacteraceae bacterium]|jgi:hypothetical protein|nr:hypothetical protein [Solirubrobacteraceae bacterium]